MVGLGRPLKFGECCDGFDVHHIETRGSGGGDEPENLITLCRNHHNAAHAAIIPVKELKAILSERFDYRYD
jgi:hypothetical protein